MPRGVDDFSHDMVEALFMAVGATLALPWAVSRKSARNLFLEGT